MHLLSVGVVGPGEKEDREGWRMEDGWGEDEGGKKEIGGCRREEGRRKRKKCLFYDVFLKIWLQK